MEREVNGLMTCDRKMIKLDEQRVRVINMELINMVEERPLSFW
jgi:hypothetical protein